MIFFNVYINGYLSERVSGVESGEFSMGLPRENNTVVFEYKKDLAVSYGDDRVTISNLNYSKDTESLIPDGSSTERNSGGSGGSINWLSILSLGMLTLVRKRFYG